MQLVLIVISSSGNNELQMLIYKSISSVLLFPVFWLILNSDYFALRLNNMLNRFVLFALNWFKFFNKFVVSFKLKYQQDGGQH